MDRYSTVCQIGKGACGAVFLVRSLENKKLYALKKIQLDESRKSRTKEAVLREARILSELKHPHIVAYHESFFDEKEEHLCIIQDYCDGGTLEDKIREMAQKKQHFPEKTIIQWFLQITMAVRYMHSNKVLHRDLKTSNIFMNKSGTVCKLGDFGIAKNMHATIDVASTCVGTPCYLSPEMCQDIPYSSKADVWALGCLLYEMLALTPAFDANNLVSLFYKIVKGEFEPLPPGYTTNMENLVKAVLVKVPEERPSTRGILLLPYVKEELIKFIEEKEVLLQQRKSPRPLGSRPYSTPALSSSRASLDQSSTTGASDAEQKRAFSCRPSLMRKKERSILDSAATGKSGRVSVIPEETEEQMLEKSLLLERGQLKLGSHSQLKMAEVPRIQVDSPRGKEKERDGEKSARKTPDVDKSGKGLKDSNKSKEKSAKEIKDSYKSSKEKNCKEVKNTYKSGKEKSSKDMKDSERPKSVNLERPKSARQEAKDLERPKSVKEKGSKETNKSKDRCSAGSVSSNRGQQKKPPSAQSLTRKAGTLQDTIESLDYYIDDFDDDSDQSDLEDDIPEEIPGSRRYSRSNSLTQTFEFDIDLDLEIPEIPEELPDGKEADDEDYDDDFDEAEEEIEEELDKIVNVAREARADLDTEVVSEDETIIDENENMKCTKIIKKHVMHALGKDRYEQMKNYCENNNQGEEFKKLEKEVGKENMKTFYLMNEVLTKKTVELTTPRRQ